MPSESFLDLQLGLRHDKVVEGWHPGKTRGIEEDGGTSRYQWEDGKGLPWLHETAAGRRALMRRFLDKNEL